MAESQQVKYVGPPGMSNDTLGGELVPGETYEAPSREAYNELLEHPGGWFEAGGKKASASSEKE